MNRPIASWLQISLWTRRAVCATGRGLPWIVATVYSPDPDCAHGWIYESWYQPLPGASGEVNCAGDGAHILGRHATLESACDCCADHQRALRRPRCWWQLD